MTVDKTGVDKLGIDLYLEWERMGLEMSFSTVYLQPLQ